jgi:predicted dehydrogenase
MSIKNKLGVAVVGLGVGEEHARKLAADKRCSLRLLYDLDKKKTLRIAARYQGTKAAPDYRTMVESKDINLIIIASYDDAHFHQATAAMEAGKHLFVEKPICQNLKQIMQLKALFMKHHGKIKLGSNLILRSVPLYKWLRDKIQNGDFGQIYAFDGDYLYGRIHKITEGWRGKIDNYSAIQGGGIHLIDLMLWLTGKRPESVFASGNRICTAHAQQRFNDFYSVTMQDSDGFVCRITTNLGCVHRHQHVMRIFGTKATFIFDDAGPRLHLTRDPAVRAGSVNLATLPLSKGDLLPEFVTTIIENKDVEQDIQSVFDGISITDACEKSMRAGRIQKVAYI